MDITEDLKNFALEELKNLVRIPSISFAGFDHSHLERSAEATSKLLQKAGFKNVELCRIDGCFPYVLGEFIVDPKLPTALLYAHHDVQPPGREELWQTPPFDPILKDGRLYGRGSADDKAGILVHAAALKYFTGVDGTGKPPINLKVIIEGEEEVGSNHLLDFLKKNKERLRADLIVVTDTANIQQGIPSLTVSLRGMIAVELKVKSLRAPLHSGLWGGGVVDPVQVLVKILGSLTDAHGNIQLKSIKKSKSNLKNKVPLTKTEFAEQAGVVKNNSVPSDFLDRIWNQPSFSINAIQASSEKLANNIICDRAYARVGIRLTSRENAHAVQKELISKIKSLAPKTVEIEVSGGEPANAWSCDTGSKQNKWAYDAAHEALEKGFGQKAVNIGCGASIPFIAPFEKALNAPVITFGVEDPYTLAHGENESLYLDDFYKAIAAEIEFFKLIRLAKARGPQSS